MAALLVGEITDRVHSRDNSLQCVHVPSVIVLNALSVVTVCQCDLQLLNAITTFLCGMESWPECADVFCSSHRK